jgi:hypothetical protein
LLGCAVLFFELLGPRFFALRVSAALLDLDAKPLKLRA